MRKTTGLTVLVLITFVQTATLFSQIDPFRSPSQPVDPFAAPSGSNATNPFAEGDPLKPKEREDALKPSDYVDVLPVEKKRAIVVIEGEKGKGTGFISKIKGVLFVVTNIHVIKDNDNLKFMTMDGDTLNPTHVFAAKGYDIALIKIENQYRNNYFDFVSDVFSTISTGDKVLVVGNSMGDGTILQTKGKIISIGPKLIEHDAPTFTGNSGSPIIETVTWKVVGVDTLSRKRDLLEWYNQYSKDQKGSQIKNDIRLFGYRLDTIDDWERITFHALRNQHEDIEEVTIESLCVLSAVYGSDWHYQKSDTVSRVINQYLRKTSDESLSHSDREYQKKIARSALYNHLMSMKFRAETNRPKSYHLMKDDYDELINFIEVIMKDVGKMYQSESSVDPFETR